MVNRRARGKIEAFVVQIARGTDPSDGHAGAYRGVNASSSTLDLVPLERIASETQVGEHWTVAKRLLHWASLRVLRRLI
jgi:hypothetical protein